MFLYISRLISDRRHRKGLLLTKLDFIDMIKDLNFFDISNQLVSKLQMQIGIDLVYIDCYSMTIVYFYLEFLIWFSKFLTVNNKAGYSVC